MSIEYGDETLTLVEIDQPFCSLDYGNSPCSAQLGVTETKKCYNTRFTCQDPENYDPADKILKFSYSQEDILGYGLIIPSLLSISTSPLRVNIGSMDQDMSPFGERETVTLTFADHLHSDLDVDKYRTERPDAHGQTGIEGFNPYEAGTFWSKWLVRNPYHEGYPLRIKEGRFGDDEAELRVRHYIIDKIDGPSNGKVTVKCKDLFTLVEERKAEAPVANTGELSANITAAAGSLTLSPTGIGDEEYSNSGRVVINSEIIEFTRATGSDVLTLVTRGDLNTVASAHEEEDKVQELLEYDAQRVDDIIADLLTNFADISPANIPTSEWSTEASNNLPTLYTAYIGQPTPVIDLIAELAEQVGFTLWPDVETNLIELRAVGVNIVPVVTVNDDDWLLSDSLNIERDPDLRVSRVQVFYGQINPLEDLDDETNYRSVVEARDLNAEEANQYGTKSVRKIFSRWIQQFGRATATTVANLVLALYRDPPFRATFDLDIQRSGQLSIASPFALKTRALVSDLGVQTPKTMLPMAISRGETSLEIEAQKLNLFSEISQQRIINIDDDVNNVNLRDLHDSLYSPAGDGADVKFIISSGTIVGADAFTEPAMDTGLWPAGVTLTLELEAGAFLCGSGGYGGSAGSQDASDGTDGGNALLCQYALNLTNNGVIGGGGGGGGGVYDSDGGPGEQAVYSGGGGGAGTNNLVDLDQVQGGLGGSGNIFGGVVTNGSLETGGVKSDRSGGDLGQDGDSPSSVGRDAVGVGGSAGAAIDGDSLVTHLSGSGDIRGAQIN